MAFLNVSLTSDQLAYGVKKVVASLTQGYQSFTAWTVTEILRNEVGPQIAIPHDQVRSLVHDLMVPFVEEDYYDLDTNWQVPNSTLTAIHYSPTDLWTINNVVPQLNSSAQDLLRVVIPNIRVNSTLVRGISYSGTSCLGDVTIKLDTASYTYSDVPFATYLKFINADSKGEFYNKYIKGQFECVKLYD